MGVTRPDLLCKVSDAFLELCKMRDFTVLYNGTERHGAYEWRAFLNSNSVSFTPGLQRYIMLAAFFDCPPGDDSVNEVELEGSVAIDDGNHYGKVLREYRTVAAHEADHVAEEIIWRLRDALDSLTRREMTEHYEPATVAAQSDSNG